MNAVVGWLRGLGDERRFALTLAAIALGIGLFLVVPLAPRLVPMHELPTNLDYNVIGKPQGVVTGFWVLSMGGFVAALWLWRRGQRPSWRLLLGGAAVLHLLAFVVPPVASEDVYAYSFYGVAQAQYHDNPYTTFPDQHPLHLWHPFWSWREVGPVYGPPFLLLLRLVAGLAGPSLLAWVLWMKLLTTAAELAAVWLLVRCVQAGWRERPGAPTRAAHDPRWPLLLIAWNPMVLQAIPMSAHVDALLLLLVAGALMVHLRRHYLAAFVLLVGCFLIKVYLGPLAALYALWLAAGRPPLARLAAVARLGLLGAALTVLAYLPFASAGTSIASSVLDVSGHYSSGSPPNVVRRLVAAALPLAGVTDTTAAAIGDQLGRQLGLAAIAAAFLVVAWRLRPDRDPWPALGVWFLAYLLVTPWVFYWHEVPLLGIFAVVPWGLASLVAVTASVTMVPVAPAGYGGGIGGSASSATRELVNTLAGLVSRYGATFVALAWGLRHQRRTALAGAPTPEAPSPAPGQGAPAGSTPASRSRR